MLYRMWHGVKAIFRAFMVACVCWWALVWLMGSYQAGRVLGVDDLIPTADRWLAVWAVKGRP
jgi:hypothetical protein